MTTTPNKLVLHNYFRSSAAYRVRIAMNLKGLDYDYIPVHLTREGGMQFKDSYTALNPQQLVPLLYDDGFQLSQSLAIIEYLDEKFLKYLTGKLGLTEDDKAEWIKHWLELGLTALEADLARAPTRGKFCFGDTPTVADCALVPQLFSAARFNVDTQPYPTLRSIYEACEALPEFAAAHPARQPDSE